jgi:site-specific DNA-cytosine methylase
MNIFIDLFSGLGGASVAFDAAPNWHTIKIDNNPELLEHNKGLHIMDLTQIDEVLRFIEHTIRQIWLENPYEDGKVVVWASPPCQQYSFANANRDPDTFDNTLLTCTIDYLYHINPDYHIIENVKGAIEEFNDILEGPWKQRINAMYLWGHFPLLAFKDSDVLQHHRKLDAKGSRSLRPNYRALVPACVSEALLSAIECQRLITDW